MGSPLDAVAGGPLGALILEQLQEERARKSSLEQRGAFVITSAGALATLLLALAAVVTMKKDYVAPHGAKICLALAGAFFVVAAAGGLMANLPWRYAEVTNEGLGHLVAVETWEKDSVAAARRTAEARVNIISSARRANATKAVALIAALGSELAGTILIAAAIAQILRP